MASTSRESLSVAVLGTGANGSGVGVDLAEAGYSVTFVDQWPDNVEAIRRDGIRIEFANRVVTRRVPVLDLCDLAAARPEFDVVFVLVKAYDTRWALELVLPYLAEDGVVVGLQNGMTDADLVEIAGPHRSVAAVLEITAAMDVPGIVSRHSDHDRSWFAVGAPSAASRQHVELIAEMLRNAGRVEVTDDIVSAKWMKLVLNAAELVPSALLDLSIADCVTYAGMRDVMIAAGNEALRAAQLMELDVRPLFGMSGAAASSIDTYVSAVLDELVAEYIRPESLSTVLQDWHKGRHAEFEEINGAVARVLESYGEDAPVNQAVVEFARAVEAGQIEAGAHLYPQLVRRMSELGFHGVRAQA